MYHNINAICDKIDLIKLKADRLRIDHNKSPGPDPDYEITQNNWQLDDIKSLCLEVANSKANLRLK